MAKTKDKIESKNIKVRVLDDAFDSFKEILNEFAKIHDLSEEDYEALMELANNAYLEKKMTYFLEDKFYAMSIYLDHAAGCALKQKTCKEEYYGDKLMYVKQLKHMFANE